MYSKPLLLGVFVLIAITLRPADALANLCNASGLKNEFELIGGYSPKSSTLIATARDRKFVMGGVAYSRVCRTINGVDIAYTATFLPVAIVLQPALPDFRSPTLNLVPEHAVYGLGALPLGFSFRFGKNVVQPFVDTHGGIIVSAEPVPINAPDSTALNFMFDVGGGVRFRIAERQAVNIGYKFLHVSNGYTTSFNPGLDNNVVFASFTFLR